MGWYHTFPVASPQRTDQICDMTAPESAGIVLLQRASMDDHEPSLDFEELPIVLPEVRISNEAVRYRVGDRPPRPLYLPQRSLWSHRGAERGSQIELN